MSMRVSNLQLFSVCVLIWGSTWLAITFQLGAVAPEMSVGYRFLAASATLFAYCRWRAMPLAFGLAAHLDFALFGAFMFCIGYIFVYYAETYIVSGMVAVGYSASPMLNMFAARLFSARRCRGASRSPRCSALPASCAFSGPSSAASRRAAARHGARC
jgi:drug/metabolite transporter (DMT)-like permease